MRTLITKKIKMYGDEGVTYAWLIVNKCDKTVELRLAGGKAPKWELGIAALLLDKDVRKMVQEYCITAPRKNYFNLYCREGMSGCRDICINILKKIGEKFRITKKVKLIHISCQDKLNYGIPTMWIGDFVELAEFLNKGTIAYLRKNRPKWVKVKYLYEPTFELDDLYRTYDCKSYLNEPVEE